MACVERRVWNIVSLSGVVSGSGLFLLSDITIVFYGFWIVILDIGLDELAILEVRLVLKPNLRY